MATKKNDYGKDATHGSPKNPAGRYGSSEGPTATISYAELDGKLLQECIDAVTRDGCAMVFSRTSDGGALAITLLEGTNRHKYYPNSREQAERKLDEWREAASWRNDI